MSDFYEDKLLEEIESLQGEVDKHRWRKVEDEPIIKMVDDYWVVYDYIDKLKYGFMAYVPTNQGAWICHCFMRDEVGLQGVLDGEPYDIGREASDVTMWKPITPPEGEG